MPRISATYASPLGTLMATSNGEALTSLRFASEGAIADSPAPHTTTTPPLSVTFRWLDLYFSGREPSFLPSLAPQGTAFQQRVWQELLATPYGSTVSYGELARRIGCRSPQAVGQAVGKNPIILLIPCHRVVAAHSLGGYAYGAKTKYALLRHEQLKHPTRNCNPSYT